MTATQAETDRGPTRTPLQRRTLLQLALAASAGAALPKSLGAQTPTPSPPGHADALRVLVDRVTNYDRNKPGQDKKIWQAAEIGDRDNWFELKLAVIDKNSNVLAISATEKGHGGYGRPGIGSPRDQYDVVADAMKVVKDQVPVARARLQHMMHMLELDSMWYAYQVGYQQGWCRALNTPTPQCIAGVTVKDLDGNDLKAESICRIHVACGGRRLTEAPAGLDSAELCRNQPRGLVRGHESY